MFMKWDTSMCEVLNLTAAAGCVIGQVRSKLHVFMTATGVFMDLTSSIVGQIGSNCHVFVNWIAANFAIGFMDISYVVGHVRSKLHAFMTTGCVIGFLCVIGQVGSKLHILMTTGCVIGQVGNKLHCWTVMC